ncbi:MAG: histidine kinase [Bacteroidota bacterium]|nr:histidine kinase [Bacteroidota bacterium]
MFFLLPKRLLFILLCIPVAGMLQLASAQEEINNFRRYTVKDGLSSNYIKNLTIDTKGFLWVGTLEGVNRFDGTSFRSLLPEASDFAARAVETIVQLNDSVMLIGTHSGLVVFNLARNRFQNNRIRDTLLKAGSKNVVRGIVKLPRGRCFVTAGHFVFLLDETLRVVRRRKVAEMYKQDYSIPNWPVFLDQDSTRLLVGVPEIKEFDLANFKTSNINGTFGCLNSLPTFAPSAFYKTDKNKLLYATWNMGLNYLQNGVNYPVSKKEVSNPFGKICKDPVDPTLYWITSGNGLLKFNENERQYSRLLLQGTKETSRYLNACRDLVFDKHQNLWIGTEAGLVKISAIRKAVTGYHLLQEAEGAEVIDVVRDKKNRLWLSSWGNNLLQLNKRGKLLRLYNEKNDGTGHLSEKLFLAADTVYAATSTGTFYFHEGKQRFVGPPFPIPDSLKKGGDKIIFRDSHFNWWIGIYGRGLYRYNTLTGKSCFYSLYRSATSPEYLEMLYPTSIAEDSRGHLWMGRASGSATFTRWDPKTESFTVVPARFNEQVIRNFAINSIAVDGADNVWLATTEFGLLQYNSVTRKWAQYGKSHGLKSLFVPGVVVDAAGNVWAGTYNGLSILYRGKENFITLTDEDGLPFNQITWIGFPDKKRQDSLLIAGMNRFAWLALPGLKTSTSLPEVSIQFVYVNNEPFFDFDRHSFHHTQSGFRFLFTAVNLQNGQDNVYAYRLKGADRRWTEIGKTQEVTFHNLAAGRYVFEVKARNPEGIWSQPATWAFTIERPYYQQWWFYILLAATITATGYSLYRYRLNRILMLYQMRSRISRDLHDEVGSTLSSISIMNEMAKAKANGNAALNEKIADNLQKVQNSMQYIVWAVNPRNDDLDHLLLRFSQVAQDMLEAKGIVYDFTTPADSEGLKLSMEHRREVYLIYKEWLNNIIKYSGCTKVDIRFSLKGKNVYLRIADNGKGFDTSINHPGNGLRNMEERAKAVKGSLFIFSEEGRGSVLELKVPLS